MDWLPGNVLWLEFTVCLPLLKLLCKNIRFLFRANTERTAIGPWGAISWNWQKVYGIRITDWTFNTLDVLVCIWSLTHLAKATLHGFTTAAHLVWYGRPVWPMQRIQILQDLVLIFCKPADEGHRVITLMKHPQPDAALTQTRTRTRIQTQTPTQSHNTDETHPTWRCRFYNKQTHKHPLNPTVLLTWWGNFKSPEATSKCLSGHISL